MTANAGDDARAQCMQGGMDGYVAKPIQDKELLEVIRAVVPASLAHAVSRPPSALAPAASASRIDRAKLLSSVGGSLPVLRQLVADFRQDAGPLMDELAGGVEKNECKAVHRAAHTLKGMVNFFGVPALTELAAHLEKMGASADCAQAPEKLAAFRRELDRLQADLDGI
jgi:HPt (histidine-containing phosphotransfer) domain-containing protein